MGRRPRPDRAISGYPRSAFSDFAPPEGCEFRKEAANDQTGTDMAGIGEVRSNTVNGHRLPQRRCPKSADIVAKVFLV
jgi:hypothetical protein